MCDDSGCDDLCFSPKDYEKHRSGDYGYVALDILCSGGGDCVVFVDRLEDYHIVAIIWFGAVLLLGLVFRLSRRVRCVRNAQIVV
jgi:hypothetical protein